MPDSQKNPGQARVDAIFQALKKASDDKAKVASAADHTPHTDTDLGRNEDDKPNARDASKDITPSKD